MIFSNPWFFAFMACVLGVLAVPMSIRAKKNVLVVASSLFYAFWDYRYLGLLLGISVVDYYCAKFMKKSPKPRRWLVLSIVSNLSVLAYFKYTNFFIDNVNAVLASRGLAIPHLGILLPAGISFYTFKTMSYVIDVYRGELTPVDSWLDYATFITFFPELIAGPIVRASVLIPQLDRAIGPTRERFARGSSLFLLGFTKKICADHLGVIVTPVFAHPTYFDAATNWAATLGYSLQIYCDFAGYSDMAVGAAKMVGYDLPENFNMPYLSKNVAEFWRRWHMTLSFWLRDYLYIPLGGNRRGHGRTYANLLATMVLGGLWHGASWNFVLWGTLHGGALAVHRFVDERRGKREPLLPRPIAMLATFVFVSLCWIPFRSTTFGATRDMLLALVGTGAGANRWISADLFVITSLVGCGHIVGALVAPAKPGQAPSQPAWLRAIGAEAVTEKISGTYLRLSLYPFPAAAFAMSWVVLAYLFASTATNPFIYFQF